MILLRLIKFSRNFLNQSCHNQASRRDSAIWRFSTPSRWTVRSRCRLWTSRSRTVAGNTLGWLTRDLLWKGRGLEWWPSRAAWHRAPCSGVSMQWSFWNFEELVWLPNLPPWATRSSFRPCSVCSYCLRGPSRSRSRLRRYRLFSRIF